MSETNSTKVKRAGRVTASIVALTVIAVVTACVLLLARRPQACPLSLFFENYGRTMDMDFKAQDVAFFWITNSSDKIYGLPMTGGTNTFRWDTPFGHDSGSYLIRCEFSDPANPMPQVSFASLGLCYALAPHSAVRIRVPLPPKAQAGSVAVLCAEMPSGSPRRFWTKGIGLWILRALPRSVGKKLLFSEPAVQRICCDLQLSHRGEKLTEP